MATYNKFPEIEVSDYDQCALQGYKDIVRALKRKASSLYDKRILVIDCYPGVRYEEIKKDLINPLNPKTVIFSDDIFYSGDKITEMIQRNLTDDRVFGVLSCHQLTEFIDHNKLVQVKNLIDNQKEGLIVVYGVGASLISEGDILIYADLARWEIQQRFRSGELPNWKMNNYNEDILRKYKRGFFFEWRIADRHKKQLYKKLDFLLDTNEKENPKFITKEAYLEGLKQVSQRPFRLVPYFDPGVWGGQWMKEVCGLDPNVENYAWSFDGVPEENSIYLRYGKVRVEIPSINVVFKHPIELLGNKVHARFGDEFPIRFDFLDTMGGQNLSLQVHPLTEYIQEHFGMQYTQDESYYLLDSKEDAVVYLGVKKDIDPFEMMNDLREAEKGELPFPDDKYINKVQAEKHDHFLIPAGTIHCSGKNVMVLEISATPYIFTFKLWDWGRVGMDGLPRPVHIDHGERVIQWDRDAKWVEENLINRVEGIAEGDGWREELTGLHEREFIETRRHWFFKPVLHSTHNSVNVLNLVEGEEAIVESPTGDFSPFVIRYAETFIIPECVKEYTIRPYGNSEGKEIATIKAFVRV